MASDIPAFLQVGTPVSAKFKGAFCEATIKSLKKFVKCKVLYKDCSGSVVVADELIQGELKLNALVQVKQDHGESKDATIQKMNDHSQYTVVFDDGDERTLRRTNVCVMGERHFQEHENLDNLPLTDPENFLSPVVLPSDKRRKRRRSQPHLDEEDSDSDGMKSSKRWDESDKEFLGKVVCVEQGERKKSWFPALGLKHFGSHPENQIYVQSFKDGRKMLVKKTDVKGFCKDKDPILSILKGETKAEPILRSAIEKALSYHDMGELPKGWNILDTIDEKEDSSDDDAPTHIAPILTPAEKLFQENVYSFLTKQGNPITKPPLINNQGINLQKLFESVTEFGGFEEVTNPQWRNIYKKMGLRNMHTTTSFNMKTIYKRYLLAYEDNVKTNVKASPSHTKSKSKRNTKDSKESNDNIEKSESDSELERRRSTRSTRSNFDRNLSFELNTSRRRSNVSLVDLPLLDDGADRSTCSSKDLINDHELDMKSEVEDIDVVNSPDTSSITSEEIEQLPNKSHINAKYKIGSKISVRYGSGKNLRHYTAKILDVDHDEKNEKNDVVYFIHYNGWNRRYNEWIKDERIAGLTTNITNKKKQTTPPTPITKIAKDPPLRYKDKQDSDTLSISTSTTSNVSKPSPTAEFSPTDPSLLQMPSLKIEKPSTMPIFDKPPSPVKSPTTFHHDSVLFTSEQISSVPLPPVITPVNKLVNKAVVTPTNKSVNKAVVTPHIKPVNKAVVTPTNKCINKAVVAPTNKSVNKAVVIPHLKPVNKPVITPTNKPVVTPTNKPISKSVITPVSKSVFTPADKTDVIQLNYQVDTPVQKSGNTTVSKSVITPFNKSVITPVKPVSTHANKLVITPVNKPVITPVITPVNTPIISPVTTNTILINKTPHHPKALSRIRTPVGDGLIIPDIKPSPIKPRMTRNSMQDTFLLNALEESIGKPNPAAMNLQADILSKSEPPAAISGRRRSFRQPSQLSPKSENTNETDGTNNKDEKDESHFKHKKEETKSVYTVGSSNCSDMIDNRLNVATIETLDRKESSKVDSVKKWIEDSSIELSKNPEALKSEVGSPKPEFIKLEDNLPEEHVTESGPLKRGRRGKAKKMEEQKQKRKKNNESDNECEETKDNKIITQNPMTVTNSNNNLLSEKDRTSETAQTLSDFCNIVENVHKLDTTTATATESFNNTNNSPSSPNKNITDKSKKHQHKHEKTKRRRTKSFVDEENCLKSPTKNEKKGSPVLEYNVDFISDLGTLLETKEPNERISIMQTRLNSMRELYCKLRTEVASIDRRKRRKLRKQ